MELTISNKIIFLPIQLNVLEKINILNSQKHEVMENFKINFEWQN